MPEQIRCPSCDAALRVPETLLGKNVKCPKCQSTFLAEMEELTEPQGVTREPAPSSKRRRPEPPEEMQEEEELPPEDELEEEEERPRRRRRRKRRYAEAEALVHGPATALQVIGILDIALGVLSVVLNLLGFSLLAMGKAQARRAGNDPDIMVNTITGVFSAILGIVLGVLITIGATKMKKLNSYGLAMTACIISLLPCHSCCCLGIPFGIWGLVALNKPGVKDAFS